MARAPKASAGVVLGTARVTVHYVVNGEVVVASPGDLVEVSADEAAGLVASGAIVLPEPAAPQPAEPEPAA